MVEAYVEVDNTKPIDGKYLISAANEDGTPISGQATDLPKVTIVLFWKRVELSSAEPVPNREYLISHGLDIRGKNRYTPLPKKYRPQLDKMKGDSLKLEEYYRSTQIPLNYKPVNWVGNIGNNFYERSINDPSTRYHYMKSYLQEGNAFKSVQIGDSGETKDFTYEGLIADANESFKKAIKKS